MESAIRNLAGVHELEPELPESLAMCLWTCREGEDAGFGKIMWGKIMLNFYDFARHDFAALFIRNRKCRVDALSRKSLMIGANCGKPRTKIYLAGGMWLYWRVR